MENDKDWIVWWKTRSNAGFCECASSIFFAFSLPFLQAKLLIPKERHKMLLFLAKKWKIIFFSKKHLNYCKRKWAVTYWDTIRTRDTETLTFLSKVLKYFAFGTVTLCGKIRSKSYLLDPAHFYSMCAFRWEVSEPNKVVKASQFGRGKHIIGIKWT